MEARIGIVFGQGVKILFIIVNLLGDSPVAIGELGSRQDYTKSSSQLHINYKGATSWNNLPVEMCLIQTYTQFKNMQKKLMQNLL